MRNVLPLHVLYHNLVRVLNRLWGGLPMSWGFYFWHFSLQSIQKESGAHPMCCPLDTIAVSSGIEGAGLEASYSPSSKNA